MTKLNYVMLWLRGFVFSIIQMAYALLLMSLGIYWIQFGEYGSGEQFVFPSVFLFLVISPLFHGWLIGYLKKKFKAGD